MTSCTHPEGPPIRLYKRASFLYGPDPANGSTPRNRPSPNNKGPFPCISKP